MITDIEEAIRQFVLNNAQRPDAPQWVKELAAQYEREAQPEQSQQRKR